MNYLCLLAPGCDSFCGARSILVAGNVDGKMSKDFTVTAEDPLHVEISTRATSKLPFKVIFSVWFSKICLFLNFKIPFVLTDRSQLTDALLSQTVARAYPFFVSVHNRTAIALVGVPPTSVPAEEMMESFCESAPCTAAVRASGQVR